MSGSAESFVPQELWRLSDADLLSSTAELEAELRRGYAAMLDRIDEIQSRGLAATSGYPDSAKFLRDLLRVSLPEARRRLKHAHRLSWLPETAEAAHKGEIGSEHVDTIVDEIDRLPAQHREDTETQLVDLARKTDSAAVKVLGKRIRQYVDQDGKPPPAEDPPEPRNSLRFRKKRDGRTVGEFDLDVEGGKLLDAVLSPLAKPRARETRSTDERYGDAMVEALRRLADSGALPTERGERPHLNVTVPLELLEKRLKEDIDGLTAGQIRMLACDCKVIPAILGSNSEPLDVASPSYVVPAHIRRALVMRDRGCTFPNCERPAKWTEAHHIIAWAEGGTTEMINLTLVCREHHRLLHASEWEVAIVDGRAIYRPPPWIDPERRPLRNDFHHPPDC